MGYSLTRTERNRSHDANHDAAGDCLHKAGAVMADRREPFGGLGSGADCREAGGSGALRRAKPEWWRSGSVEADALRGVVPTPVMDWVSTGSRRRRDGFGRRTPPKGSRSGPDGVREGCAEAGFELREGSEGGMLAIFIPQRTLDGRRKRPKCEKNFVHFQVVNEKNRAAVKLGLTRPGVIYLFGPCRGAHSASPPLTGIALSITVVVPNRETGMEPVVLKKLVLATGRRSVFGALFDKSNLKEEKRRRRSPSVVSKSSSELERPTILWRILRFLSHHRRAGRGGNLEPSARQCEGARYAVSLEIPSKPSRIELFNLRV